VSIQKVGTSEKIYNTVVANEEFEQKWNKLSKSPIRCSKCHQLVATGGGGLMTLQKNGFKAIADLGKDHGSMDIKCPRCETINRISF
jgi:phage FluMu protein Com